VTEPRGDFDGEVARVERDARAGRVAEPGPARALYRRAGFREAGRRVGYYPEAGGAAMVLRCELR